MKATSGKIFTADSFECDLSRLNCAYHVKDSPEVKTTATSHAILIGRSSDLTLRFAASNWRLQDTG